MTNSITHLTLREAPGNHWPTLKVACGANLSPKDHLCEKTTAVIARLNRTKAKPCLKCLAAALDELRHTHPLR